MLLANTQRWYTNHQFIGHYSKTHELSIFSIYDCSTKWWSITEQIVVLAATGSAYIIDHTKVKALASK